MAVGHGFRFLAWTPRPPGIRPLPPRACFGGLLRDVCRIPHAQPSMILAGKPWKGPRFARPAVPDPRLKAKVGAHRVLPLMAAAKALCKHTAFSPQGSANQNHEIETGPGLRQDEVINKRRGQGPTSHATYIIWPIDLKSILSPRFLHSQGG